MRKFLIFLVLCSLLAACKSKPPFETVFIEPEPEPEIQVLDPEFEIVSIAIIKADLVNTQFEAILKINNPNVFALDLKSLSYELYGNDLFWASGKGVDLLHIPAGEARETGFYFIMNFINMNRKLLDDVIRMHQVNYRFLGDVSVEPDIPNRPSFNMSFERSGFSIVKEHRGSPNRVAAPVRSEQTRYVDNW
jgi:LEA14-like dessication related protein